MTSKYGELALVLDHYQQRHTSARTQKTKCPFHEDATASMTLNLDTGLWYCHACAFGGSGVDFIMQKEGTDFRAARDIYESITNGRSSDVRSRSTGESSSLLPSGSRDRQRRSSSTPAWLRR